jgi:hypothetical protein
LREARPYDDPGAKIDHVAPALLGDSDPGNGGSRVAGRRS